MDLTEEQYKQKYLKYKAKYIELKQQAGAEDERDRARQVLHRG